MSKIERCNKCGGNIVTPAYEGDGAYPVEPMCQCDRADGVIDLMLHLQNSLRRSKAGPSSEGRDA